MKELFKLVWSLTVIGVACGGILAYTDEVTREPIAQAKRQELLASLKRILPKFDNEPDLNTLKVSEDGEDWTFYVARKQSGFSGAAFVSRSNKGYGGIIEIVAGLAVNKTISGVEILSHSETPGLGARITEEEFRNQFKNWPTHKTSTQVTTDTPEVDGTTGATTWKVKKDGGQIDSITGATISSRAVLSAINKGLSVYHKHAEEIEKTDRKERNN